jgi:hypothetical protein
MLEGLATQAQATAPSSPEQEKSDKSEGDDCKQPGTSALAGAPTLIEFLHTVPAPLVALLVRLAAPVSSLRHVAQVLSWQAPWVHSWLLLAAWWATVLFASSALRSVFLHSPGYHELTVSSKVLPPCCDRLCPSVLQTTATTKARVGSSG